MGCTWYFNSLYCSKFLVIHDELFNCFFLVFSLSIHFFWRHSFDLLYPYYKLSAWNILKLPSSFCYCYFITFWWLIYPLLLFAAAWLPNHSRNYWDNLRNVWSGTLDLFITIMPFLLLQLYNFTAEQTLLTVTRAVCSFPHSSRKGTRNQPHVLLL